MKTNAAFRGKYKTVAALVGNDRGVLLDIGARDRRLASFLTGSGLEYRSADVSPGCDYTIDLEGPLSFEARSFDVVVALDVLEHVNNLHAALNELLRITSRKLVIALPNLAFLPHRLSFLARGRLHTDKYDLPVEPKLDRHRWLTTATESASFMRAFRWPDGWSLTTVIGEAGGGPALRALGYSLLAAGLPLENALCDRMIFCIERAGATTSESSTRQHA